MSHSPTKSSISSGGQSRSPSIPTTTRPITVHHEQISLTIHRPPNTDLGISIAGGIGSTAYKDNDHGIFLTKVIADKPASQAGLLVGDKLLSVNGISLIDCEHSEAVSALKNAGDNIEMIIMREIFETSDNLLINNENFSIKEGEKYSTIIQRDEKQGGQFGFSIAGGNQTITTNNSNENFYISKINNQDKTNSLAIGDRLLSINGRDTTNITHDQAINMINNGGTNVELTLYREKITNGNNQNSSTTTIIDNTIEVCLKRIFILF
jgi:C-terminal processing protease CtpA/Prc